MNRKTLEEMGLTKEQIDIIMKENGNDINNAKSQYDDIKMQLDQAKKDVEDRDKQIENIKKSAGDNEDLTQQIATLQAENKAAKEKYEADMKDLKITNAIKLALNGKVYDEDIASGLFDKSKLILGDDGKITGLAEQLESIKTAKSFLFKEEKPSPQPPKPGFNFNIGAPGQPTPSGAEHLSLKDAIAAKFTQTN